MIISPATDSSSAVTANVMAGGMMSNISAFIKKNVIWVGLGAAGLAGAIYLMTRKKKSSRKGLSGVSRKIQPAKRKSSKPKRMKPLKIQ